MLQHVHPHAPKPVAQHPAAAPPTAGAPALQAALVVQREITTEAECLAAIATGNFAGAVQFLIGRSPQDIERLLGAAGLDIPKVEGLLAATPAVQHTVRGLTLEAGFRSAKGKDWPRAARYLSVLDDPGIDKNLTGMSEPDLKQLFRGSRLTPGGGDDRLLNRIKAKLPGQEVFGHIVVNQRVVYQGKKTKWSEPDLPYKFHIDIAFTPDPVLCDAPTIAWLQTMRLMRTGTDDSLDNRSHIKGRLTKKDAKRGIEGGAGIDRANTMSRGWYGQENDDTYPRETSERGATPGKSDKSGHGPASMTDEPDGKFANSTWEYEASVIARGTPDDGMVYAVVKWGFTVDANLQISFGPPVIAHRASTTFNAAVGAWNAQAADASGPKGQQPLPVARMRAEDAPAESRPSPSASRPMADAVGRGRIALALQRSAGNAAVGRLLASAQRQKGPFDAAREEFEIAQHRAVLDPLRGLSMEELLPAMAALPQDVRTDEKAAEQSAGNRSLLAMRAVAARGTPWERFLDAQAGILGGLPGDQVGAVVRYLGGPKDSAYYPADKIADKQFGGRFDGSLDPVAGLVTLYFRARIDTDAVRWGPSPAGTPAAEQEAIAGRAKFEADFKRVVESTWSFKGGIRPGAPIGAVKQFRTRVVVAVVPAGEHTVFHLHSADKEGRQNAGGGEGNLKTDAAQEGKPRTSGVVGPDGKRAEVTTVQAPAAHEFGHAIGLSHVHGEGNDDVNYGVTAEERQDVMGAGNLVQVIRRGGKVVHDDFGPFEAIAKAWGVDHMTGELARFNTWSAV